MQEALRLFPPGHIAIREAVEDLDLDGHFVPKGTWIHVRRHALAKDIRLRTSCRDRSTLWEGCSPVAWGHLSYSDFW